MAQRRDGVDELRRPCCRNRELLHGHVGENRIFHISAEPLRAQHDPTTGNLAAKIHILEQVTLDPSGNQFTGTVTIDAYDPKSALQADHVTGTISATRVTVDQITP